MSALGQKQTCAVQKVMSALPRKRTLLATLARQARGHLRRVIDRSPIRFRSPDLNSSVLSSGKRPLPRACICSAMWDETPCTARFAQKNSFADNLLTPDRFGVRTPGEVYADLPGEHNANRRSERGTNRKKQRPQSDKERATRCHQPGANNRVSRGNQGDAVRSYSRL